MKKIKGFIEVTVLSYDRRFDENGSIIESAVENKVSINIDDISIFGFGYILFRRDTYLEVKETYDELKQLVKSATEI